MSTQTGALEKTKALPHLEGECNTITFTSGVSAKNEDNQEETGDDDGTPSDSGSSRSESDGDDLDGSAGSSEKGAGKGKDVTAVSTSGTTMLEHSLFVIFVGCVLLI